MKKHWLIVILLIASCAPVKTPTATPVGSQNAILTPRPVATLTQVQPTPVAKLTKPPAAPTQEVSAEWKVLAGQVRRQAQRAKDGTFWENVKFRDKGYELCNQLIAISDGQQRLVSQEILKRWRWGIEFMNYGELDAVIRLIDQYN
jgi:hypothetical protein